MTQSNASDREARLPLISIVILGIAGLLTVLVLGSGLWLTGRLCSAFPGCITLNEWGDFTAGAFAPIAFVWLVAAVLLQTIELREQRKELALTRQEFVETRGVMAAQVNEAKAQAQLMGVQTDLLVRGEADRELQMRLRHLRLWLHYSMKQPIPGVPTGPEYTDEFVVIRFMERLEYLTQSVVNFRFWNEFAPIFDALGRDGIEALISYLRNMVPLRDQVSAQYRSIMDEANIVSYVAQWIEGYGDPHATLMAALQANPAWYPERIKKAP